MKRKMQLLVLILSATLLLGFPFVGCAARHPSIRGQTYGPNVQFEVSFEFFHRSLSPYGNWVNVGSYGPCWRPSHMVVGWQPYYNNGYWAYTEYGWTWISGEPWGSIVYHYGTWFYDPVYGWVWVPGYVWGPAWVSWQYTDIYIGWAPLPPTFRFTVGRGIYNWPFVVNNNYYVFIPAERITMANLNTVRVPVERNVEIVRRARPVVTIDVVNNHIVNHGPTLPVLEPIKHSPTPMNQLSREARIQPRPVQISRERPDIEVASPKVNRQEARRVIKDFDREERGAWTDRKRELKEEGRNRSDQIGARPRSNQADIRREREQRQQQEKQLQRQDRQQQRAAERLHKQQERGQRRAEPPQHKQ